MHRRIVAALALAEFTLAAAPVWAAPQDVAKAAYTTVSGVVVPAPKDWRVIAKDGAVVLTAPEGDLSITVIDIGGAKDADAAVVAGWAKRDPAFARKLEVRTPVPAKGGWAEGYDYSYVVSPNEKREVGAVALRAGTQWTVVMLDGAVATAQGSALDFRLGR